MSRVFAPPPLEPTDHFARPKYRPDIDGLRAVAVVAVVTFHAFPDWLKGGYVGVDVFFVISGFLISSIILENLDRGSFTFRDFYIRRVRRIFPPLVAVLVACLAIGWAVFLPRGLLLASAWRQLTELTAASAGFVANLALWQESSYFDTTSELKPLLHLWSLGVEEQYYLIWPALLWFAVKRRWSTLWVMASVAAVSFAWNVRESWVNPVGDFYSPLTRLWELSIGSCLAYVAEYRPRLLMVAWPGLRPLLGAGLIAASIIWLSSDLRFPGWYGLLPTLGAALIISGGPVAWFNRAILSNRVVVAVGLISYPLYLWHWPLLSFATIANEGFLPPRPVRLALVAAAFVLAWASYVLIERPIRFGGHGQRKAVLAFATLTTIGIFGFALSTQLPPVALPGKQDLVAALNKASAEKNDMERLLYGEQSCFRYNQAKTEAMFVENGCLTPRYPGRPTVFLIGDSFSASLSLGIRPLLAGREISLLQVSSGWCEIISDRDDPVCPRINKLIDQTIVATKPDVLIVSANWVNASGPYFFRGSGDYMTALAGKLGEMHALGAKQILLIGQFPIWRLPLPDHLLVHFVARGMPIPERTFAGLIRESLDIGTRMRPLGHPPDITYLSVTDALCDDSGCLTRIGPDLASDLTAWDNDHLTIASARYLVGKLIAPALPRSLGVN